MTVEMKMTKITEIGPHHRTMERGGDRNHDVQFPGSNPPPPGPDPGADPANTQQGSGGGGEPPPSPPPGMSGGGGPPPPPPPGGGSGGRGDDDRDRDRNRSYRERVLSNASSTASKPQDIYKLFKHLSKPVPVSMDKNRCDKDSQLEYGQHHFITRDYVSDAVSRDHVIVEQRNQIELLTSQVQKIANKMDSILEDNRSSV
jgi:hypothetical protein